MMYKIRQILYRLALVVCIVSIILGVSDSPAFAVSEGSLPEPIVTGQSVELVLNSRDSQGALTDGTYTDQQISNILWGAGRAPLMGSSRNIYLATGNGTYEYYPDTHSLSWYSSDNTDWGAFEIVKDADLPFDNGLIYMPALLASVSMWDSTESPLANCPKGIDIAFGEVSGGVPGLTSELVAICSVNSSDPQWLPAASTNGTNSFEGVLANLNYTDNFTSNNLTLQQISQLLWAGYGCTPHPGGSGKYGLTVPSWSAEYFLTEKIYFVNENGVYRYHNREPNEAEEHKTRDHRKEQTKSGDFRAALRSDVSGLPEAPLYVIISLWVDEVGFGPADWEVGFPAFNMLMQATALDLGAHFKTELTAGEEADVRSTANITSTDVPQVIVSIGYNAQPKALASYSDATHSTPCDNFTDYSEEHIVYMYGTNLTANHNYRVVYYDGSDNKTVTDDVTSGASGNISSQHTFDVGTDVAGTWNVIVCEPYFIPSSSHNGSWAYAITSDSFTVQESAIPEFPTVMAAIVALSLCVVVYLWMRRKAVPVPVKSSIF